MPTTIHIPRAASPFGSRIPLGLNGRVGYIPTGEDYLASDAEVAALQALNIQIQMTTVPPGFIQLSQRMYGSRVTVAINGGVQYLPTGIPIQPTAEQLAALDAAGRVYRGSSIILPMPLIQSVSFGELTRRGFGGHRLGYTGNGTLSITIGDAGIWTIVNNELVLSGTYGTAPPALAGPYIMTVSDGGLGVSVVTVNIVANAAHVAPRAADTNTDHQMQSMVATSILRWGDSIIARDVTWFAGLALPTLKKGAAFTQRSGGPAAPVNDNDLGWVKLTSDTPLGAKVWRLYVSAQTVAAQDLWITGIDFPFLATGAVAQGQGVANACLQNDTNYATVNTKITGNRFRSGFGPGFDRAGQGGGDNIYSGLRWLGLVTDPTRCDKTIIRDNEFTDLLYGMVVAGRDYTIAGNTLRRIWVDCINGPMIASAAGKTVVEGNFLTDKLYGDGAYHGDFIQTNNGKGTASPLPTGSYFGPQYRRNVIQRGIGRTGFQDGQGIYISDVPDDVTLTDVVVENNFIDQTFTRAISLLRCVAPIVRLNTIVQDRQGDSGQLDNPSILLTSCTGGTVDRNIVHSPTGTGPGTAISTLTPVSAATITADNLYPAPASYNSAFFAPVFGALASALGIVRAAFSPVANGPARMANGSYMGATNPDGSFTTPLASGGTSATRYSFAATRGRLPSSFLTQNTATYPSQCTQWVCFSPDYVTTDPCVVVPLFIASNTGDTLMSGGSILLRSVLISVNDGAWVEVPGASYAGMATLDGSSPSWISPAFTGLSIPANARVVVKMYWAASGNSVQIPRSGTLSNIANDTNSYERIAGITTANDGETGSAYAGRFTGLPTTVPVGTSNGQGVYFAPFTLLAKGGDGRPAWVGFGPSGTMYGTDDESSPRGMTARAASGAIDRGFDSNVRKKRLAFCNFGVGGSRMMDSATGASLINVAPHYTQKMAMIEQIRVRFGALPFDEVLVEPFLNNITGTQANTLSGLRAVSADLQAKFSIVPAINEGTVLGLYDASLTFTPNAPSFTYPYSGNTGIVWFARDMISKISKSDPTAVLRLDGTFKESWGQYRPTSVNPTTNPNSVKPSRTFSTVVAAAITAAQTTFTMVDAPIIGESLEWVNDLGQRSAVIVTNVTGAGPYTVTTGAGAGGISPNPTNATTAAGATLRTTYSKDGTHPTGASHVVQAAELEDMLIRMGQGI